MMAESYQHDREENRINRELESIRQTLDNNHNLWHSLQTLIQHAHETQQEILEEVKKLGSGMTKEDAEKMKSDIELMTKAIRSGIQPSVTAPPVT